MGHLRSQAESHGHPERDSQACSSSDGGAGSRSSAGVAAHSRSGVAPPTRGSRSLFSEFATSGASVACATTVTNPLDVIKTRMQLRQAQPGPAPGLVSTGAAIVRGEGAAALWKGLPPAVLRGLLYGGLRLGLYSPTRDWVERARNGGTVANSTNTASSSSSSSSSSSGNTASSGGSGGPGQPSASTKVLAGAISGGVAAAVSSPTELVKVRLQVAGSTHSGAMAAAREVVAEDGVLGLWKGATPGLVRASVLTASQCATYDESKRRIMAATGWGDTAQTHLACAMVTGLASTLATNPVDVVKTRMFVAGGKYSGPLACAAAIRAAEGPAVFFRGFWANYSRLGPQTVVTFLVAEQLRRLAGLQAL